MKKISENEEIRNWFRVSSNRKKIWNIQLWLLEEVKRICKKHNIKYYADWWTMLWTVRHKWFIPWDDDLDTWMFRKDYKRFIRIAKNELPKHIKLIENNLWWHHLINTETVCLPKDDQGYITDCWIAIDIFPMDYASKFKAINQIKSNILYYLKWIIDLKHKWWENKKVQRRKKLFLPICKIIFGKINTSKLLKIYNKINEEVLFKWDQIYTAFNTYRLFPASIYNKSHDAEFENTTICIPDWYDTWLKIAYWDYMEPVIFPWWHNCRYSVNKSYKDIIKTFDKSKSNEENYRNCKDLFVLD